MTTQGTSIPTSELFADGGEMGTLMRATDWSKTKLGPVDQWPKSLRTMLGVVLGSRFPMLLWWGPDLLHLYNDAYRPILRDKHPTALGAPAAQVWAEVWDVAGPMARSVQDGGPATWTEDLQLFINSGAMAEETYFTFSYSPVPGDDGRIGGLLNTVQETTEKVQSAREIQMLHDLVARAGHVKSEADAYRVAADVLSTNELDLPFALIYVVGESAREAKLAGACGAIDGVSATGWPFAKAIRDAVVIEDLAARVGTLPVGRWGARPESAIVLPLTRPNQPTPYAFLVAGISPHRALDDRYRRFFRATADQVMTVVANARSYEAETKRAETLAELDRAKTIFFNNVSHEFRTPLTLMLGPVEDILADTNEPPTPAQRERLELIYANAQRLLKLVTALLDFSRIEAGRMRASYAPTNLGRLTTQLASAFTSAASRIGLRFVIESPSTSEDAYVDREMWEKIVLNLLSNAFKFTFEGQIGVRLVERESAYELAVEDTGTGIPDPELAHVFERFHRVQGAKSRTSEGTGIGLSMVRELVRLHGGAIEVLSVVGAGTTFTVTIPKGHAHLPADAIKASVDAATPTRDTSYVEEVLPWLPDQRPRAPRADANPTAARILLVDDNADLRTYLSGLLAPYYTVEEVTDGLEALEAARARLPDLVLSDVMMPRLDGLGLLRELRANTTTRDVPFILLSARAGEEATVEGLDAGADDYLVKPFSARELLARVRTHLELARSRRIWAGELAQANKELEAFSYSVSHDLRAPLRAIDGFSKALLAEHASTLDDQGRHYLERVRASTQRMSALIDDMLKLSQLGRALIRHEQVDLTKVAASVVTELRNREPTREVVVEITDGLIAHGDRHLLAIALENLLGNAWKFTSKRAAARIWFGRAHGYGAFCIRDNGAGFDMQYAEKLFAPFQRQHKTSEFEGTGVGLATVQRIVARHGGRVWAEAAVDNGAAFFFTLEGSAS